VDVPPPASPCRFFVTHAAYLCKRTIHGPTPFSRRGKESRMLTTAQGLPAAANVQQAIIFAQLQLLRQLEAQRRQR
jgi:hypothetical protein